MSGRTVEVACERCKARFVARVADRARGWARFCSKRCKAIKQSQRGGTLRGPPRKRHDGRSPMKHKLCDTCGAPAINGVHTITGIEWGCELHHDTSHPFSSDALGQW